MVEYVDVVMNRSSHTAVRLACAMLKKIYEGREDELNTSILKESLAMRLNCVTANAIIKNDFEEKWLDYAVIRVLDNEFAGKEMMLDIILCHATKEVITDENSSLIDHKDDLVITYPLDPENPDEVYSSVAQDYITLTDAAKEEMIKWNGVSASNSKPQFNDMSGNFEYDIQVNTNASTLLSDKEMVPGLKLTLMSTRFGNYYVLEPEAGDQHFVFSDINMMKMAGRLSHEDYEKLSQRRDKAIEDKLKEIEAQKLQVSELPGEDASSPEEELVA